MSPQSTDQEVEREQREKSACHSKHLRDFYQTDRILYGALTTNASRMRSLLTRFINKGSAARALSGSADSPVDACARVPTRCLQDHGHCNTSPVVLVEVINRGAVFELTRPGGNCDIPTSAPDGVICSLVHSVQGGPCSAFEAVNGFPCRVCSLPQARVRARELGTLQEASAATLTLCRSIQFRAPQAS